MATSGFTRRRFIGTAAATAAGAAVAPGLIRRAHARTLAQAAGPGDLVLVNANIITMDSARPDAQAVAVSGGRIVAVGSYADVSPWIGGDTPVLDLGGRTLMPGFYDSHNHLLGTGQNLAQVDLSGTKTLAEVLQAIGDRATATPPGEWVVASSRWHESQLAEKRFPRKEELDAVAPNNPVYIPRGGHNIVVNSVALQMAGIDDRVTNPPGGTYSRDPAAGALTGHMIDAAATPVRALLPRPTDADIRDAIVAAQRLYNQAGITSVIDPGQSPREIGIYRAIRDAGDATVRASVMWRLAPGFNGAALQTALDQLTSGAVTQDADDPWVRTIAIKLGVDGGVEAGFYRQPYAFTDDPESPRGKPLMAQENFNAVCAEAARQGWQVGTHCVGDAGIDMVLAAYNAANQAAPIVGKRWTLVHMMYARDDHWAPANQLGLIVTAQQPLMFSLADGFVKYIGPDRAKDIEPLKMYLARSTQPVGGGSDSPVTPYQPLTGIWSSVTRVTDLAGIQGPEWRIPVEDALRMYTMGSAWSAFEETTKGSITPGKFADLIVLDADPRGVDPNALKDLQVMQTIVDGRVVFDREEGHLMGSAPRVLALDPAVVQSCECDVG